MSEKTKSDAAKSDEWFLAESSPVEESNEVSLGDQASPNHERHTPQLPRDIRAVKDANTYNHRGRNIIVCLDGTGDQVCASEVPFKTKPISNSDHSSIATTAISYTSSAASRSQIPTRSRTISPALARTMAVDCPMA